MAVHDACGGSGGTDAKKSPTQTAALQATLDAAHE